MQRVVFVFVTGKTFMADEIGSNVFSALSGYVAYATREVKILILDAITVMNQRHQNLWNIKTILNPTKILCPVNELRVRFKSLFYILSCFYTYV